MIRFTPLVIDYTFLLQTISVIGLVSALFFIYLVIIVRKKLTSYLKVEISRIIWTGINFKVKKLPISYLLV
jgi:hypothetical protein